MLKTEEGRMDAKGNRPAGNKRGVRSAGGRGQPRHGLGQVEGERQRRRYRHRPSDRRILVTLIHEMIKRDAKKGLASLCIGGGMGVALAVER